MRSVGLVDAHAYSLIGVREITTAKGKTERLCWIRNPWGKKEWDGDWSDRSDKWDDHTKAQVPEYKDEDDGCFWISFKDYDKFFYITTICFFKEGYKDNVVADELTFEKEDFGMCKLVLNEDAEQTVAITLDQINARFADETMRGDYSYCSIKFMVTRIEEGRDAKG